MSGGFIPEASYTVRCSCGKRARIEPKSFGLELTCEKCRIPFRVEWSAQGTPRMVYLADQPPIGNAPAVKPAPPRDVEPAPDDVCACGQILIVRPEYAGRAVKCPACGVVMRFERVRDPKTKQVTLRRMEAPPPKPAPKPAPESKKSRGRKSRK